LGFFVVVVASVVVVVVVASVVVVVVVCSVVVVVVVASVVVVVASVVVVVVEASVVVSDVASGCAAPLHADNDKASMSAAVIAIIFSLFIVSTSYYINVSDGTIVSLSSRRNNRSPLPFSTKNRAFRLIFLICHRKVTACREKPKRAFSA
jgi:hypothetical protein